MSNRIDPPELPSPRGPWPEVTDPSRLHDHGQPWCINAAAHPEQNGGYPDPDRHLPWHECRSREAFIDGVRRELHRDALGLSVYLAAAFRFGQDRAHADPPDPRIVLETWEQTADAPAQRLSLDPGEALRLARVLVHLVDDLTYAIRTT